MKKEKLFTGLKTISFLIVLLFSSVAISQNVVADTYTGNPQATAPTTREGRWYYDDVSKSFFGWNGTTWLDLGASGGSSVWGSITGTLSNQTDLQAALDAKTDDQTLSEVLTQGNSAGSTNLDMNQQQILNTLQQTYNNGLVSFQNYFRSSTAYEMSFDGTVGNSLNWNYGSSEWRWGADRLATSADLSTAGTDDQTAAEVTIVDAEGLYASSNVEGALGEIDNLLSNQDQASELSYNNSTSGLTATTIQAAIDEIDGTVDGIGGGISDGDKGDITVTNSGTTWTIDNVITSSNIVNQSINDEDISANTIGANRLRRTNGTFGASEDGYIPTYDFATVGLTWVDPSTLSGSTYTAPENFILSTGANVLTDANIHNGAASIINVLNVVGTGTAEISNLNPTEIDIFSCNTDIDGAILEITSASGWSSSEIGSNTAVRLTGEGAAVGFEETGANTGVFRIYAGPGVSYFTPDITPPLVTSATIENANPDQLVALFDESVDIIDVTGLSLDSGLSGLTFTGIISNVENSITFQLSGNAANGDAGNFVYGGTNTITDTEGNALASGSTAVTNNIAATTNLFDGANAADPENEVDGTANTGTSGGSPGIITSVSGDSTDGSFALRLEHNNGASGRAIHYIEINSTFQASSTYQIQFDVKEVAGDATWDIAFNDSDGWESDTNTTLNETSGWTTVTVSKATLASFGGNFRFRIQTDNAAAAGDAVLVDNFRVTRP